MSTPEKSYTVGDAVDKAGFGRFQIMLTVVSGLGWTADACEVIILSLIGDMLACQWTIHHWENALLTSGVFMGMMFGSPFFGYAADKYGRKRALTGSMFMLFIFGCLSAAAPSYWWILILRSLMGFSLGGIPQALTLCCEYYPVKIRAKAGFFLCYFWSLGTIGIILIAWAVMVNLNNWRVLLAIAALPALIVICCLWWYPESARFYLVSGNYDKAEEILKTMATQNKVDLPEGHLHHVQEVQNRGRLVDLFSKEHRLSTILFWYIWFAVSFTYYGIALMTPHIAESGSLGTASTGASFVEQMRTPVKCTPITSAGYIKLLWTSSAELPGLLVFTFMVEMCDRKKLLGVSCILTGVLLFLLLIKTKVHVIILIFLFGARAIILAVFQLIFIMCSETYPTTLRAMAMGSSSAWCRFGGMVTPFVSQVLVQESPIAAMSVFALIIMLCGVSAFFLPKETRGVSMEESPDDEPSRDSVVHSDIQAVLASDKESDKEPDKEPDKERDKDTAKTAFV